MPFSELSARLTLDSRGFTSGVESAQDSLGNLQSRASEVGGRMKDVGSKMAMGISAPLIAAGGAAVREASKVEEMSSKMSVVFGDLTEDVQNWADAQAEATGLSTYQFQKMATTLGDTFKPLGFATDEAADMSKEVASLAGDLSSFNNMSTDEALNRLRGGLIGNHENLREFGVIINQTNLGEQLEEMFGKGVKGASEQEKMLARLQLVQEGTADAQNDLVRTADSTANKFRAFKGSVRDLAVEFGQELLPIASDLLGAVTGLVDRFSSLDGRTKRFILVVAGLAAALGPVLMALGVLLTLPITGTMAGIVAAVALAAGAFVAFKDDIMPVIGRIVELSRVVGESVSKIRSRLAPFISLLKEEFGETVDVWVGHFRTAFGILSDLWGEHGDAIMSVLRPLFENIELAVEGLLDAMITVARVGLAILRGDFGEAFDILLGFLDRQTERFKEAGKNFIRALINGIKALVPEVEATAENVADTIRDYLPSSDAERGPLSDLTASGKALPKTFASGIEAGKQAVTDAVNSTAAAASPEAAVGGQPAGQQQGGPQPQAIRKALEGMAMALDLDVGDETLARVIEEEVRGELRAEADRASRGVGGNPGAGR